MRRPFLLGFSSLLGLALAAPRLARADEGTGKASAPSAEAEAHIAHGLDLRRQRHDAEALAEFRAAYGIAKSSRAQAQIALAEDALGLWVDAEEAFENVLAAQGDPWVDKRRDALGEELRTLRTHLADVEIECTPASAGIWIGGVEAHRRAATGTFRVVSGRVLIEAKAPGFEPDRRVLEAAPGAHLHETIALSPAPPPPPAAVESTAAPATPPPPLLLANPTNDADRSSGRISLPRTLAIASFAIAGGAAIVGTVGAIKRTVDLSEYDNNSFCDYNGVPRSVRCAGVASDFSHSTTIMTAGYATAGVAAVAGGLLAFAFPGRTRVEVAPQGQSGFLIGAAGEF
jgi:hypothetical protein